MNTCQYCNKCLSSKYYLQTHENTCKNRTEEVIFKCQYCEKILSSKCYLQSHENSCKDDFSCQYCDKNLGTKQSLKNHEKMCHHNKEKQETKKTKKELVQENETLKIELKEQKLKEQYDKKEMATMNSLKIEVKLRYEKEINELKKINNEYVQFNKETLKSVVKTNTELSKKPNININGQRINNTTINTSQPLTVEVAKKILDNVFKYHQEVIDNDADNLITSNAEMISALYMTDDLSNILKLTDSSRNTLKFNIIDEETNEIKSVKDPKGKLVVNYLIDNNIIELQNIAESTSVKKKFITTVMNKEPAQNAPNYFPVLNKYGRSIEYFNAISNKEPGMIDDLGIQIAKKSMSKDQKDHKELNDQKEKSKEDVLLKCQNMIMKLKIYTADNYQDILVGNTFKVNIWLRAALKELGVVKEWYVSDSMYGTVKERRSEDYLLLKSDDESIVKLNSFDVMRMLKIVMITKLPNIENIGIGEYVEKYIKWIQKSYNNLYKNIDEETKELILEQTIEQMKKNIVMYNLDFENDKETLLKNWINIISG
jgi:hypothetical protein